jgi:hypothetical protein
MRLAILLICLAALLMLPAALTCAKKQAGPSAVGATGAGVAEYKSPSGQFALQYPSDWSRKPTKEYALLLEREPKSDSARVTIEVPYIPPHLPGMMTMRLVVNGYVDDLKKRLSGLSVVERCDDTLAGTSAQRLVMTGRVGAGARQGEERMLAALIAIRKEQVYILEAHATPESFEPARDAMAKMARDWEWTK